MYTIPGGTKPKSILAVLPMTMSIDLYDKELVSLAFLEQGL